MVASPPAAGETPGSSDAGVGLLLPSSGGRKKYDEAIWFLTEFILIPFISLIPQQSLLCSLVSHQACDEQTRECCKSEGVCGRVTSQTNRNCDQYTVLRFYKLWQFEYEPVYLLRRVELLESSCNLKLRRISVVRLL